MVRPSPSRALARRAPGFALQWLAAALLLPACIVPDGHCGAHMVYENDYCECAPGFVPDALHNTCVPCGAHEKAQGAVCICEDGYSRPSAGAACEPSQGLGETCSPGTSSCANPAFPHCRPADVGGGYCTRSDCTQTGCPTGWLCTNDPSGVGTSCRRPPLGQGQSCKDDTMCAGTEATLCDSRYTHSCLVQGCTPSPDGGAGDCQNGTICCDLTALGLAKTVCAPLTKCP